MDMQDPVIIAGYARTPIGGLSGELKDVTAPELGAAAIAAAVAHAGLDSARIEDAIMGCVLSAGLGQAPARQAALRAGLPESAGCLTINKMCGSGMKAIMLAHDELLAGSARIVVAGGMESMSNAPYLLDHARSGYRLGHGRILDHMLLDGLEDAYEKGRLMGEFAEDCARDRQITRRMQDEFALDSLTRARKAQAEGAFDAEIAPVHVVTSRTDKTVALDERPLTAKPEDIPRLKPVFREGGTVTAANSSSISDGAAAVVLTRAALAEQRGLRPLALLRAHVTHAGPPACFPTAPIDAVRMLMERLSWSLDTVDLFEINEAFAVVALAAIRELGLPRERVNIHGGACALGHPIGASGARIVVTLLSALERHGLKRGIAALCIGGGEATALAVERIV